MSNKFLRFYKKPGLVRIYMSQQHGDIDMVDSSSFKLPPPILPMTWGLPLSDIELDQQLDLELYDWQLVFNNNGDLIDSDATSYEFIYTLVTNINNRYIPQEVKIPKLLFSSFSFVNVMGISEFYLSMIQPYISYFPPNFRQTDRFTQNGRTWGLLLWGFKQLNDILDTNFYKVIPIDRSFKGIDIRNNILLQYDDKSFFVFNKERDSWDVDLFRQMLLESLSSVSFVNRGSFKNVLIREFYLDDKDKFWYIFEDWVYNNNIITNNDLRLLNEDKYYYFDQPFFDQFYSMFSENYPVFGQDPNEKPFLTFYLRALTCFLFYQNLYSRWVTTRVRIFKIIFMYFKTIVLKRLNSTDANMAVVSRFADVQLPSIDYQFKVIVPGDNTIAHYQTIFKNFI